MVSQRVLVLASAYQLGAAIVFSLLSLWLCPERMTAVLFGGLLMTLNFWALRFFAAKALGGSQPKVAYALLLSVKLVAVMGLLAIAMLVLRLDALGIALGLSTLFVGIGFATAHQSFSQPKPDSRLEADSRAS
ncbi:MAG: hypothetical protein V3T05_02995 [Myxococcota bacterium]